MADTYLKLKKVLEETKDPVALESAKLQLQAAETAKPQQYQPSQNVQTSLQALTQKETQRPQQYKPSQAVTQAQQNLANLAKPADYQNRYDTQINNVLDTIYNRKAFTYDAGQDPMYKTYRDTYLRAGERAAADAAASAASLTGGYGSTYGNMVANQANQNYIAELNNQIPVLMDAAYARYQNELADNYNQLAALQGQEQIDYGKWRDLMGDYQVDRDYLSGRYDTEYSKDYQQYRDTVSDYNTELAYLYTKYNDMSADDYEKYRDNMDLWLQDRDYYLSKYGLAQDQHNWQTEWDYAMQKAKGSGGGGGRASSAGNGNNVNVTYKMQMGGIPAYSTEKGEPINSTTARYQEALGGAYDAPHYVMEAGAKNEDGNTRVYNLKDLAQQYVDGQDVLAGMYQDLTPEQRKMLEQLGKYY